MVSTVRGRQRVQAVTVSGLRASGFQVEGVCINGRVLDISNSSRSIGKYTVHQRGDEYFVIVEHLDEPVVINGQSFYGGKIVIDIEITYR